MSDGENKTVRRESGGENEKVVACLFMKKWSVPPGKDGIGYLLEDLVTTVECLQSSLQERWFKRPLHRIIIFIEPFLCFDYHFSLTFTVELPFSVENAAAIVLY